MMTPTQTRMFDLLRRGPRTAEELRECLWDELSGNGTIRTHISNLRSELEKQRLLLSCAKGKYFISTMLAVEIIS